jgi:3'(2'), 5'-bisphosphate nucleotidase
MGFDREAEVALAAVRQAALLCRQAQPKAWTKEDRSPVTVADFASQAAIGRALSAEFPNDPVMSEESSAMLKTDPHLLKQVQALIPGDVMRWIEHGRTDRTAQRFWTVDPVDGTKGFLRGGQYAVALALIVGGQVQVGVLGCPNLDGGVIFSAVRGSGSLVRPLESDRPSPIHVSSTDNPAEARLCESVESAHSDHDKSQALIQKLGLRHAPIRMDSQAKYGVVARGSAELFIRFPRSTERRENVWDHAAGALILTEAGGQVTDLQGTQLDFSRGATLADNVGILVSNGRLHDTVLRAMK